MYNLNSRFKKTNNTITKMNYFFFFFITSYYIIIVFNFRNMDTTIDIGKYDIQKYIDGLLISYYKLYYY